MPSSPHPPDNPTQHAITELDLKLAATQNRLQALGQMLGYGASPSDLYPVGLPPTSPQTIDEEAVYQHWTREHRRYCELQGTRSAWDSRTRPSVARSGDDEPTAAPRPRTAAPAGQQT